MSAEEARAMYDALGRGTWRRDSRVGIFCALNEALSGEFVRRVHALTRERDGARTRKLAAIPGWIALAYVELRYLDAAAKEDGFRWIEGRGLGQVLHVEELTQIVDELVRSETIENLSSALTASAGAEDLRRFMSRVEELHAEAFPRAQTGLRAFFEGMRMQFCGNEWGEPKARELALLACARELEPIKNWKMSCKHWNERVGRWRKDMDHRSPSWRGILERRLVS